MEKLSGTVKGSGPATAQTGGVAISGINFGDIHTAPAVRSSYSQQVRRIAPAELVDRQDELNELAEFCTGSGGIPLAWWQAPAWSGKSALMAWFVLHPPPGVRVVSFFITARWAGNSDRSAFVDVLLEQLAEVTGLPLPALLTSANREAHLLGLLEKAAQASQEKGQRLILVVDGLDEDRGVTVEPGAYSIAALLPATPPAGMRIVVAGRPDPPVPVDVPDDHPLRDPGVIRRLMPSEHARVIKADAVRELKELLHGSTAEQDLAGLVAAAGGGLSGRDLAELTGLPAAQIEDQLTTVSGRSFSGRASSFPPQAGPVVYVFAHEDLQEIAIGYLGIRLDDYRQRLHSWAEGYRDRRWPEGTPEYLLRGYHQMLLAIGDVPRIVALTTDRDRQDRMLDMIGGDSAAITQIVGVQELIYSHADPDLVSMLRLTIARDRLFERNTSIPANLPPVWIRIGNPVRGMALADSIQDADLKIEALIESAQALSEIGYFTLAQEAARGADDIAAHYGYSWVRVRPLTELAKALKRRGDIHYARQSAELAESAACDDENPRTIAENLVFVVEAWLVLGDAVRAFRCAERAASTLCAGADTDSLARIQLAQVKAWAALREPEKAEVIAGMITDPEKKTEALAELTRTWMALGDTDRALHDAELAEVMVRSHPGPRPHEPDESIEMLINAMKARVALGDTDRARQSAELTEIAVQAASRTLTNPEDPDHADIGHEQTVVLLWIVDVVQAWMDLGDTDRARRNAEIAENLATSDPEPISTAFSLAISAEAWVSAGNLTRAHENALHSEIAARSFRPRGEQIKALAVAATALAEAHDIEQAKHYATQCDSIAQTSSAPEYLPKESAEMAIAWIAIGDLDRAQSITDSIADGYARVRALTEMAVAWAARGEPGQARENAQQAHATANSIAESYLLPAALAYAVRAWAAAGDLVRAQYAVDSITDGYARVRALTEMAVAWAARGEPGQARENAQQAHATANSMTDSHRKEDALAKTVRAWTAAGDLDQAQFVADSIGSWSIRNKALMFMAEAVEPARARRTIADCLRGYGWMSCLRTLARVDPGALTAAFADNP